MRRQAPLCLSRACRLQPPRKKTRAPSGAALSSPRVSAQAAAQKNACAVRRRSPASDKSAPSNPSAASGAEAPTLNLQPSTFNSRPQDGQGAKAPLSGSARAQSPTPRSGSTASSGRSPLSSGFCRDTLNFRARNACDTCRAPQRARHLSCSWKIFSRSKMLYFLRLGNPSSSGIRSKKKSTVIRLIRAIIALTKKTPHQENKNG